MKTAFMFPGQGSQAVGMMSDVLAACPEAEEIFDRASIAIDLDLKEIALSGPEDRINQTAITQPIVLTASLAMWQVWQNRSAFVPDYVCGHSLGEYTALVVSRVMTLEEAVRLVHLRGQLMQDAVPLGQGAMAALLGLEDEQVIAVCEQASQGEVVAAANFNSPGQVVISGSNAALERAINLAKEAGARRAAMLPVSVPCHCELLKPAGQALAEEMAKVDFHDPVIPVVQNVTASVPQNLDELKSNLLEHLYSPVRWSASIQTLAGLGVTRYVECGPGKVLAGLGKRIARDAQHMAMNDIASLEAVLGEIK
ncbi:MAG: ACP S-malonyltransferase [Oleiphilaceae bacterium]|nr:ACP S-malonyltransferase [Oleiphilaceae bacterium]